MGHTLQSGLNPVDVSIIVVNYNTRHLLDRLFAAIERARGALNIEVLVIDNASRDDSVVYLRSHYPEIPLIVNTVNVGFGRANNQALHLVKGAYVLLLNTDAFPAQGCIEETVAYLRKQPHAGVLGVKLIDSDGKLQPSCRYFPTPWRAFLSRTGLRRLSPWTQMIDDLSWDHRGSRECDWVPGCYYLMPKATLDTVGLFDPRFFLYFEEVDHCQRVKAAGWQVVFYGEQTCTHLGGESAGTSGELTAVGRQISALQLEGEWLYYRKHGGLLGVWTHLALNVLGDAILASKALLKRRSLGEAIDMFTNSATYWALGRQTRWGTVPTR